MAATVTRLKRSGDVPQAGNFIDVVKVAGDASYPTGGYSLATGLAALLPAQVYDGLATGDTVVTAVAGAGGYNAVYVPGTGKLLAYKALATEVDNATNLAAVDWRLILTY